jgi:hypothetical protein
MIRFYLTKNNVWVGDEANRVARIAQECSPRFQRLKDASLPFFAKIEYPIGNASRPNEPWIPTDVC